MLVRPSFCLLLLSAALLAAACGEGDLGARTALAIDPPPVGRAALEVDAQALLDEAAARWEQERLERLQTAVDPNERFETLFGTGGVEFLVSQGLYDTLFALGDEAFEFERDRAAGFGQGPTLNPADDRLPAEPQRVHDGERGGLDASSCRSCHFSGGPDGAGTATQVGLLRGDGAHLSSAVVRDAPHVMGLGYLELAAAWFNLALEAQALTYQQQAIDSGELVFAQLEVDGIDFGTVSFLPDGTRDGAGLVALSEDLVVRPFGHKGRHATLTALCDEALQVHHGHQSTSREQTFAARADAVDWLGPGPDGDRDDDGLADEISDAQAVMLATYLSLLPVPERRPPERADVLFASSRGSEVFDSIGCVDCHRRALYLQLTTLVHEGQGDSTLSVPVTPTEVGQHPRPENLDFGGEAPGIPLFAFTDLRRHRMGAALADDRDEVLPTGDPVDADVWLTRPLWGLADTAPYLHDGRAPTVHDAIVSHGGEANEARTAYLNLDDDDRAALHVFLQGLTRAPTVLVE